MISTSPVSVDKIGICRNFESIFVFIISRMWISWKIDANFTLKHHLGLISITFIHLFSDFKSFFISIFTPFDTLNVAFDQFFINYSFIYFFILSLITTYKVNRVCPSVCLLAYAKTEFLGCFWQQHNDRSLKMTIIRIFCCTRKHRILHR